MNKTFPQELLDQYPGVQFNDSPKLPNGERAMFVRILSNKDAKKCVDKLLELNPQTPADLNKEVGFLRVWAPDGDLVFSAFTTDHRRKHFICRLHKEVFKQ